MGVKLRRDPDLLGGQVLLDDLGGLSPTVSIRQEVLHKAVLLSAIFILACQCSIPTLTYLRIQRPDYVKVVRFSLFPKWLFLISLPSFTLPPILFIVTRPSKLLHFCACSSCSFPAKQGQKQTAAELAVYPAMSSHKIYRAHSMHRWSGW